MSIDKPDLDDIRPSPEWPDPWSTPPRPARREPSVLRIALIGLFGLLALVPLFVMLQTIKPKLPPAGASRFVGAGFTFQHSQEWQVIEVVSFGPATAPGLSLDAVGVGDVDAVVVSAYRVDPSGTGQDILNTLSEVLAGSGSWLVRSGPVEAAVAGASGYRLTVSATSPTGVEVSARLTVVASGSTMYVVSCQHTPQRATEIETGCDQVLETFEIGT
jgi:hypothetical protein